MRFASLHMKDFRGTRELEIDFECDMTVIVGRNGAGKTSILDALGILTRFLCDYHDGSSDYRADVRHTLQDIRLGADNSSLLLNIDVGNSNTAVRDTLEFIFDSDGNSSDFEISEREWKWPKILEPKPRFIFYRQERGFESRKSAQPEDKDAMVLNQKAVQIRSLGKDMQAIGDLEKWWDRRDAQEARLVRDANREYRDPQLEAIRRLIAKIDSFSGISFSSTSSPPGLHFVKNDGTSVHVGNLSGGERSYIILLADLARRLQVFVPDKLLDEIPAIVLIDEIELNLHPSWQSEILPTLARVFAACQFIVTTHSPQVLSGIERRQVRIVEEQPSGPTKVLTPLSTRGRTSNYLLEGVFAASERYPPIEQLIAEFNRGIDKGDHATAAGTLARIEEEIEDDAATLLVLRNRLKRLRNDA